MPPILCVQYWGYISFWNDRASFCNIFLSSVNTLKLALGIEYRSHKNVYGTMMLDEYGTLC